MSRSVVTLLTLMIVAVGCAVPSGRMVAVPDSAETTPGVPVSIDVLANDLVPDDSIITEISGPAAPTFAAQTNGSTVQLVPPDTAGTYDLAYIVRSGDNQVVGDIRVTVVEVERTTDDGADAGDEPVRAPAATVSPARLDFGSDADQAGVIVVALTDPDDALSVDPTLAVFAPSGVVVDTSGCPLVDPVTGCRLPVTIDESRFAEDQPASVRISIDGIERDFTVDIVFTAPPTTSAAVRVSSFDVIESDGRAIRSFGDVYGTPSSELVFVGNAIFRNTGDTVLTPALDDPSEALVSTIDACGAVAPGERCVFGVEVRPGGPGTTEHAFDIVAGNAGRWELTFDLIVQVPISSSPDAVALSFTNPDDPVTIFTNQEVGGRVGVWLEEDEGGYFSLAPGTCAAETVVTSCSFSISLGPDTLSDNLDRQAMAMVTFEPDGQEAVELIVPITFTATPIVTVYPTTPSVVPFPWPTFTFPPDPLDDL